MSLTAINRPVERPKFAVWDLEWRPDNMALRLAGIRDAKGYRSFEGIPGLMRAMLTDEYNGYWFFAHFGGAADLAFLQQWFADHTDYTVTMMFSGSSAVMVEIVKGKKTWMLVDSFFLMRGSLEEIGKSLGVLKGTTGQTQEQKMAMFYAPLPELRAYNEQDCNVLYQAIERFAIELEGLGGELCATIAGCAMRLFRRRFLKRDIRTSERLNDKLRDSYIASRVEVIRRKLECPAFKLDINSSFPSSMIEPCPGDPVGFNTRIPKAGDCFSVDTWLEVKPCHIPPMPYRLDGRVFFPVGKWRAQLSGPDFRFAERLGAVVKTGAVITFEPRDDWSDYVRTIYDLRKASTDPFRRMVYKYLLNSLYGKHGQKPDKQAIIINPAKPLWHEPGASLIRPGVWLVKTHKHAAHEHVAMAAHVTAKSRAKITQYLLDAGDAYYCDTDSIVTEHLLEDSEELGHLKLEKPLSRGYFAAPKFYMCSGPTATEVRAKGFPKMDEAGFWSVVNGSAKNVERMARPREMWRDQDLNPRALTIPKRARFTQDKRQFSANGESRPYDVSELMEMLGENPRQGRLDL